ncbi:MAG: NAD(P)H-hydrate dehydratase [Bacteroidales bacterium]|nr:NAD(P)H-hydrate dehydratase [Bacteroidales bacterium]
MQETRLLTISQIRECERFTMDRRGISSLELMEDAGRACADKLVEETWFRSFGRIFVYAGTGNNGGDGVVAAIALIENYHIDSEVVLVVCAHENARYSEEMTRQLGRWAEVVKQHENAGTVRFSTENPPAATSDDLIVDALFGIGLNKPVTGFFAEVIRHINDSEAYVVSIDTPSGLFADAHTPDSSAVVVADKVLSIQFPKTAFLLPENAPFCGEVEVVDIGMEAPESLDDTKRRLVATEAISLLLRPRPRHAHKGTFGHGLLVAGSRQMPGAAVLAATAAMRGGIGKLTVHTPASVRDILAVALPEAIHHIDENEQIVSRIDWNTLPENIGAVAMGPGLGTARQTVSAMKDILDTVKSPMVLDADALNMLAENKTWMAFLPPYSILTPHFAEFERLAGKPSDDFDRLERAREFAQRYTVVLVLKGHHTLVTLPDGRQFFNTTGNSGMATAGSGDVLTGLLLSLLAQGYAPEHAALLGVWLHGAAGDAYTREHTAQTLVASDLPKHFSEALQDLSLELRT